MKVTLDEQYFFEKQIELEMEALKVEKKKIDLRLQELKQILEIGPAPVKAWESNA